MKIGKYICLFLGIAISALSSVALISDFGLLLWKEVDAKIVNIDIEQGQYDSRTNGTVSIFTVNVVYSYKVDGKEYTGSAFRSVNRITALILQKADSVKIRYNPKDYSKSGFIDTFPTMELLLLLMGLLLVSLFPVTIFGDRKKKLTTAST